MIKPIVSSIILGFVICAVGLSTVFAQTNYYQPAKSGNIIKVVDQVQKNNPIIQSVFEDKVRSMSVGQGVTRFGTQNRLANGAVILVEALSPYVQWMIFFGMSMSVIFIIYNGFVIVINPGEDKINSAKQNIGNIVIGILILGGFYFILRIISGLLLKLVSG